MKGVWENQTGKYQSGENYRIGKVIVGAASYSSVTKGDAKVYRASVNLPNITVKSGADRHEKIEDAKAQVERVVATWFRWLEVTE